MKKCFALLLSLLILAGMFSFSASAASIASVGVSGIDLPVAGEKPDLSALLSGSPSTHKITLVEWVEYDEGWEWEKDMTANDTFTEGYWYVVYVHLQTTSDNTFSNNVACTINGASAHISGNAVTANGTKVVCYIAYQATKKLTAISSVALSVVKPVIGKTPTFAKVNTSEYLSEKYGTVSNCTNGVTWTNQTSGINLTVSNPFKEGVKYKLSYYLTAKDGYQFTANTVCTVNGAAATLTITDATHAIVSMSNFLPGDGKREISTVDITIPSPADGQKPDYTKLDATGYYSDNGLNGTSTKTYKNGIAWFKSASSYISPGTTETFTGGTNYILKIFLTPKDGYKFAAAVTAKINGKTATVETFDDGSISLSVTLTATSKEHTHTASDWKSDADYHWKACTDTACATLIGEKQAHVAVNGKCSVCGYQLPTATPEETVTPDNTVTETPQPDDEEETPSTDDTPVDTPDTDDSGEPKPKDNGYLIWIILGAVVVLGGGAFAFLIIKKKK